MGKVSWREWVGLGAGLVALGSLFLVWTSLDAGDQEIEDALSDLPVGDVFRNGWGSGFYVWFPSVLMLLVGLTVVLCGQRTSLRRSGLPQLWLVAAIVALGVTALGWFLVGWEYGSEQRELFKQAGITVYSGFGRYLGTFAVIVSLAAAILDVRAVRGELRPSSQGKPLKINSLKNKTLKNKTGKAKTLKAPKLPKALKTPETPETPETPKNEPR
jgi:hypothetical protein